MKTKKADFNTAKAVKNVINLISDADNRPEYLGNISIERLEQLNSYCEQIEKQARI